MDRQSLLGLVAGFGALLGTQLLEGGSPASLAQGPAALIVFLGTLGATLLSSAREDLRSAGHELRHVFGRAADGCSMLPGLFRDLAFVARKDGLVSLESRPRKLPSSFLRRALQHVIDGCDEKHLREILDAEARSRQRATLAAAEVYEIAGGYAPTMGILGAVLGLIRAMESLSDPDALGAGIAVAFIATIYGVGSANLLLLPIAAKIRQRAAEREVEDAMIVEGILALQAGTAPRTIERQLSAHLLGSLRT